MAQLFLPETDRDLLPGFYPQKRLSSAPGVFALMSALGALIYFILNARNMLPGMLVLWITYIGGTALLGMLCLTASDSAARRKQRNGAELALGNLGLFALVANVFLVTWGVLDSDTLPIVLLGGIAVSALSVALLAGDTEWEAGTPRRTRQDCGIAIAGWILATTSLLVANGWGSGLVDLGLAFSLLVLATSFVLALGSLFPSTLGLRIPRIGLVRWKFRRAQQDDDDDWEDEDDEDEDEVVRKPGALDNPMVRAVLAGGLRTTVLAGLLFAIAYAVRGPKQPTFRYQLHILRETYAWNQGLATIKWQTPINRTLEANQPFGVILVGDTAAVNRAKEAIRQAEDQLERAKRMADDSRDRSSVDRERLLGDLRSAEESKKAIRDLVAKTKKPEQWMITALSNADTQIEDVRGRLAQSELQWSRRDNGAVGFVRTSELALQRAQKDLQEAQKKRVEHVISVPYKSRVVFRRIDYGRTTQGEPLAIFLNLEQAGIWVPIEAAKRIGVGNRIALHQFGKVLATARVEKSEQQAADKAELMLRFEPGIDMERLAEAGDIEILDDK